MLFDHPVVVRGGGDIGSGVIWRLRRVGFPVTVLELERPLTIRRTVAFSSAVTEGRITIQGIDGVRASSVMEAEMLASAGAVPVLVSEEVPTFPSTPSVVVDARLAKRNIDTAIDQAPLVVALGPGFTAGMDCHAVVETKRGPDLGRVIWKGPAAPNTGRPGTLGGASTDRLVRSPVDGTVEWSVRIGDLVGKGDQIGNVDGAPVVAATSGVVRGLIAPGPVTGDLKIGDIDPRADTPVDTISDKALSVGGGVLEAVVTWLNETGR